MSDNSFLPRVITAGIFALAVVFFAYAVLRSNSNFQESLAAGHVPHTIVMPFNNNPALNSTSKFQRFQLDVAAPDHVRTYTYYLYTPYLAQHTSDRLFPLVLVLHNGLGFSYAAQYLVTDPMVSDYAAFVFVPMLAKGTPWAQPPNSAYFGGAQTSADDYAISDMVRIIERLMQLYPIDPTRVYVIGCSLGGTGAYAAARYFPDIFAAAVPISGLWDADDAANMTRVPLWVEHGLDDPVIPAARDREVAEDIQAAGGHAMYTEFPGMRHECPAKLLYTKTVMDWMFKQRLESMKPPVQPDEKKSP